MAGLERAIADCCAVEAQAECCEPAEKDGCCEVGSSTCGCGAGETSEPASEQRPGAAIIRARKPLATA